MSFAVSIDVIKAGLVERLDRLVAELYPNARREGHEWLLGDVHGAPGRSLSIRRTGAKAGWWKDFGGSDKGDVLTLVAAGACAGDLKAAIPWAVEWLGLGGLSEEERRRREVQARRQRERAEALAEADLAGRRRAAKGHFLAARALPGTPGERYLLGRGIDLRALGRFPRGLRFHPGLKCPETGMLRPCLLAVVQDGATGDLLTIHRTFLEVRSDGGVTKAPMAKPKRAYCAYAGGLIPLWRGASERALKEAPDGEWLTVSEGIEDGLSVALARPDMRVAAALSLSNLGGLSLPPQLGGVLVAAQNDAKPEPIAALAGSLARLTDRGVAAQVVKPPAGVKDWNDWLCALRAGQSAVGSRQSEAVAS